MLRNHSHDYGSRPPDIRDNVCHVLYRSHVFLEIAIFPSLKIILSCQINKSKPSGPALHQGIVKNPSFFLIKSIIDHSQSYVFKIGTTDYTCYALIDIDVDGKGREGASFPAIHAKEKYRED